MVCYWLDTTYEKISEACKSLNVLQKVCCQPLPYSIWVFVLILINDLRTASLQIGLDVKLELERINWIIYYPSFYSFPLPKPFASEIIACCEYISVL